MPGMTGSRLWAVSSNGNVYTLSVKSHCWEHVPTLGQRLQGFKKVAAIRQGAWGLGCDHQVYVFIIASDVPIRCKEVTFENERWIPSRGWSGRNLLPVDPWQWSSEDGIVPCPKEDFQLPSENWTWESDWCVDENVGGYLTDKGGWRYSIMDFHSEFTHHKTFRSCVRRRKWIRYRKYTTTNRWARISSIHLDPLEEPIVDLSAGGQEIPNQPTGFVAIWIATIDGRVFFRNGVNRSTPEGSGWQEIGTGEQNEVLSISVGEAGAVWAITWSGTILIRVGVDWQNVKGVAWVTLEPPGPSVNPSNPADRLVQAAIGGSSAWVCTESGQSWFRNTLLPPDGDELKDTRSKGWLRMTRRMKMVATGPGDQVWGLDFEGHQIYCRMGVAEEEPAGREWKCVALPHGAASSTPGQPPAPASSPPDWEVSPPDGASPVRPQPVSDASAATDPGETRNGAPEEDALDGIQESDVFDTPDEVGIDPGNPGRALPPPASDPDTESNADVTPVTPSNDLASKVKLLRSPECSSTFGLDGYSVSFSKSSSTGHVLFSSPLSVMAEPEPVKRRTRSTSEVDDSPPCRSGWTAGRPGSEHWGGVLDGAEAEVGSDDGREPGRDRERESTQSGSLSEDSEEGGGDGWSPGGAVDMMSVAPPADEDEVFWLWLSANECRCRDVAQIKHWFLHSTGIDRSPSLEYQRLTSANTWRDAILRKLRARNTAQVEPHRRCKHAIDRISWSKKGQLRWWRDLHRGKKWVDAQVELSIESSSKDNDGTLFVEYKLKGLPKSLSIQFSDVAGICKLSEASVPTAFGLYLSSRLEMVPQLPPLKFAGTSEEESEDWMAALSVACCEYRKLADVASCQATWATTCRGDVFVHEPEPLAPTELSAAMFWHQYGGHMERVETCPAGITWGIGHNGAAWVYTGGYGGGFFKGMASSPYGINAQTDIRDMCVYENQRWRPGRGYSERVLFTDCYSWSDESGQVVCTKDGCRPPTNSWQWTSDWMVQKAGSVGGTDKEGWQYASGIKGPFYSRPKLNSGLRRRKWIRKCKLITSGPWQEVGPLHLRDVSLQMDGPGGGGGEGGKAPLAVWAVGLNGDVLCRLGVTADNHRGIAWYHVPTDILFRSISVGGQHRVWATAEDGSAWLRGGVTASCLAGHCWFHVSPPGGCHLTHITAGREYVWAIDSQKVLWFRAGISQGCPEGSDWLRVVNNVTHVSCGPRDQVWVILNGVPSKTGPVDGVVCRRVAISRHDPRQGAWDYGIGGGWHYVSVRGWTK